MLTKGQRRGRLAPEACFFPFAWDWCGFPVNRPAHTGSASVFEECSCHMNPTIRNVDKLADVEKVESDK